MPIELDQPGVGLRPPVVGARGLGQTVVGMVANKEMRARHDRDGNPMLNQRGRPAQEEVLTIIVMEGTTGTVSGGDHADDWTPQAGEICRMIFRGLGFGSLIEARRPVGPTRVGDIITVSAPTATIWRGAGDVSARDVDDQAAIDRARAKGLSVGWDLHIGYRRHQPHELLLAAEAEEIWRQTRQAIDLDQPAVVLDDAF